jgi:DNA-binding FrmR family transcriptional regulator
MLSVKARDDLIRRLRKIEGQTQGIQRMLADGRDCQEVLNQLASVRSATRSVSLELMRHHIVNSLRNLGEPETDRAISEMLSLIMRV